MGSTWALFLVEPQIRDYVYVVSIILFFSEYVISIIYGGTIVYNTDIYSMVEPRCRGGDIFLLYAAACSIKI